MGQKQKLKWRLPKTRSELIGLQKFIEDLTITATSVRGYYIESGNTGPYYFLTKDEIAASNKRFSQDSWYDNDPFRGFGQRLPELPIAYGEIDGLGEVMFVAESELKKIGALLEAPIFGNTETMRPAEAAVGRGRRSRQGPPADPL